MFARRGLLVARQSRRFTATRSLCKQLESAPLSSAEIEASQHMRTVNRVTPGKMFMINFIAGEQSVMSIANRVNSIFLVAAAALVIPLIFGAHWQTSWVVPALGVYSVLTMYYHVGPKAATPTAIVVAALFLYFAHLEQQ
eukprot:Rhum_TRINITY_DN8855_c0_g1::Rhum_TRINITY_DN8855_c0_g1_i1::g.30206::m.30206